MKPAASRRMSTLGGFWRGLLRRSRRRFRITGDPAQEVLGVVGEYGSGKSPRPTAAAAPRNRPGEVRFEGRISSRCAARAAPLPPGTCRWSSRSLRQLNARMTVGDASPSACDYTARSRPGRRGTPPPTFMRKSRADKRASRPLSPAFSGGQRKRVAIARALPQSRNYCRGRAVSALDVSIQAEVITVAGPAAGFGLALMFIGHDLSVVEIMADRVMVLYLGPRHGGGATQALTRAPHIRTQRHAGGGAGRPPRPAGIVLSGEIPSPRNPPSGCVFRTRCPFALPACAEGRPALREIAPGHRKACIRDDLVL